MSLYNRIVESYPNRPRGQARDHEIPSGSEPDPSQPEDDVEQPMDNPLPGNLSTRMQVAAGGSRIHQRRRLSKSPR